MICSGCYEKRRDCTCALTRKLSHNLEGSRTEEERAASLRELDRVAPTAGEKFKLMLGAEAAPGIASDLVQRLVKLLDYVLEKDDSDELVLEITAHGANWQTDDEGDEEDASEYPPTLSDTVPLDTLEFSTTEELSGERFEKRDLRELRDLLMKARVS